MTDQKRLVLDANILLRAVFGVRVRSLLEIYEDSVSFYAPDICFADARKYTLSLSAKRGIDAEPGLAVLNQLSRLVEIIELDGFGCPSGDPAAKEIEVLSPNRAVQQQC